MPSLWLLFDKDNDDILGNDLPDFILFSAPIIDDILKAAGHKSVHDMVGFTEVEWGYLMEATPPQFQEPWTPEKLPWFPAKEGFAMCKTLRHAMIERPEAFAEYPNQIEQLLEHIAEIETVLQRAWLKGARFNLVLDT